MGRRSRTWAKVLLACLAAGAAGIAVPQPALGQLDAKQAEAAALQSKIEQQGQALSMADEAYNQARIERQRIDTQAASARDLVKAADVRWVELKDQLARRVRLLYMHPGAALDAYLSQDSLADLERARKFGASVLTADNDLVMATEKARQEVLARARRLDGIRDAAQRQGTRAREPARRGRRCRRRSARAPQQGQGRDRRPPRGGAQGGARGGGPPAADVELASGQPQPWTDHRWGQWRSHT